MALALFYCFPALDVVFLWTNRHGYSHIQQIRFDLKSLYQLPSFVL